MEENTYQKKEEYLNYIEDMFGKSCDYFNKILSDVRNSKSVDSKTLDKFSTFLDDMIYTSEKISEHYTGQNWEQFLRESKINSILNETNK